MFYFLCALILAARETILAPREYPGDHLVTSGPPWRTTGAAGWTRGGHSQDFIRFWTDFGPDFAVFSLIN